jgi:hypothetical protein
MVRDKIKASGSVSSKGSGSSQNVFRKKPRASAQRLTSQGSGSGIIQAVPGYEKYKFKGCWTIGNDTAYPVLNKMAVCGVPNVSDCAKRASNINLSTIAYDGKGQCEAGDLEYQSKTSTECYNTYGQGKSWAVYSTK